MIGESCPDLTHSIDSVQRLYNRDSESLFTFSFHGIEAIIENVDFPGKKYYASNYLTFEAQLVVVSDYDWPNSLVS